MAHPNPAKVPFKNGPVKAPAAGAKAPAGRGGAPGGAPGGAGPAAVPKGAPPPGQGAVKPGGAAKAVGAAPPRPGASPASTIEQAPAFTPAPKGVMNPLAKHAEERFNIDFPGLTRRFDELCAKDTASQMEAFLMSFIMALGDDWKVVLRLQADFSKMLRDEGESDHDMNEVQAMTFLQRNGAERTSTQRREEVRDVDLDNNNRICFLEYLLLHYKVMILTEFYRRHDCEPEEDLTKGGVGVTGVGPKLLDQLFTVAAGGLPAELVQAIEEFTAMTRARNKKFTELQAKAQGASVKAMAAANEIKQMENEDLTEVNRMELTLNAAKKKAMKSDNNKVLEDKKKAELAAEEAKRKQSRDSLRERAALWK